MTGKLLEIRRRCFVLAGLAVLSAVYFSIHLPAFDNPYSTAIYSNESILLGAKIADDGQWRFPPIVEAPGKFSKAACLFEDKHFYYHPGFNPFSILRALYQNLREGKAVSGGSTLTMQVVRLARKGKPRTVPEKIIELILATRLEIKYSKSEILALYASHAPFGGNVVGIEAASWRYFGRAPQHLSWSETAALAVLPNAPALIFPGRNEVAFLRKRNNLLKKLLDHGYIDTLTFDLACRETLPGRPKELPQTAPHLLTSMIKERKGERTITTIEHQTQLLLNGIMERHSEQLSANGIHNAAALIVRVTDGSVAGYYGNTRVKGEEEHGNDVDVIRAPRSSGSILKPFLYAAMLEEGGILPQTLVPDIPVFMDGFSPQNYTLAYDGAVKAGKSLSRSLNVPAVLMLSEFGVARFHHLLEKLGMKTIGFPPDHYGLSLILGGAEVTLWDLAQIYSGMARVLAHVPGRGYHYSPEDFCELHCIANDTSEKRQEGLSRYAHIFSAASIWLTFEALLEVNRPENEAGWQYFGSSDRIAWKTGTSFGFRDAWAVGVTPGYVVAVWAGNADGEGRPGLTGVTAAAPPMFEIFRMLNTGGWFKPPHNELFPAAVCRRSGFLASHNCPEADTVFITEKGFRTKPCPYHKIIHLDRTGTYRVNSSCEDPLEMIRSSWFILPPVMEYYYKLKNPGYRTLPPFRGGCADIPADSPMAFIYPDPQAKIYLPLDVYGKKGKVVFEAAHRDPATTLFWHIDQIFIGFTKGLHQKSANPEYGDHILTVVDSDGNSISRTFSIVSGK
ncbi:MAG: penicillin-binding protein 1C [Bacteroidales bacterium]|nr:penicillin-binding protein 1C [Bacteroidales bacterium]